MSLVLFLIVAIFFAYRGYKKGLFQSIVKVVSLIAGYAATLLYIVPLSAIIEAEFELSGIVGLVVASTILFVGAFGLVSLIFGLISRLWLKKETKSKASAIGGAVMGALVGTIAAIILVWGFSFANNLRPVAPGQVLAEKPPGLVEPLAKKVVSKVAALVMSAASTSPQVKSLSQAIITNPGQISQQVQRLAKSNDLVALFGDRNNQAVLDKGNASAVQQLPAFQQLVKNPDMLSLARSAGMLGETGDDVAMAEAALATQATETWIRVQQVKNDQRVQAIMNDPEFVAILQSGNPIDLLTNSKLLELANIIFTDSKIDGEAATSKASTESSVKTQAVPDSIKKDAKIYRWTDDEGRVHYSNIEPEPES